VNLDQRQVERASRPSGDPAGAAIGHRKCVISNHFPKRILNQKPLHRELFEPPESLPHEFMLKSGLWHDARLLLSWASQVLTSEDK